MNKTELDKLETILENDKEIIKLLNEVGIDFNDNGNNNIDYSEVSSKKNSIQNLTAYLNLSSNENKNIHLVGEYKLYPPKSLKVKLFSETEKDKTLIGYNINNIDLNDPYTIEDKDGNLEFVQVNTNIIEYDIRIILTNYYNYSLITNPSFKVENKIAKLQNHYGIRYNDKSELIYTYDLDNNFELVGDEVLTQIIKDTNFEEK